MADQGAALELPDRWPHTWPRCWSFQTGSEFIFSLLALGSLSQQHHVLLKEGPRAAGYRRCGAKSSQGHASWWLCHAEVLQGQDATLALEFLHQPPTMTPWHFGQPDNGREHSLGVIISSKTALHMPKPLAMMSSAISSCIVIEESRSRETRKLSHRNTWTSQLFIYCVFIVYNFS